MRSVNQRQMKLTATGESISIASLPISLWLRSVLRNYVFRTWRNPRAMCEPTSQHSQNGHVHIENVILSHTTTRHSNRGLPLYTRTYHVQFEDNLVHGHVVHFAVLHHIVARLHGARVLGVTVGQPLEMNGRVGDVGGAQKFGWTRNAFGACGNVCVFRHHHHHHEKQTAAIPLCETKCSSL